MSALSSPGCAWVADAGARRRQARPTPSAARGSPWRALELVDAVVVDAEVVGDLVSNDVVNRCGKWRTGAVDALERSSEDRDLARHRRVLGAPSRSRHALVEPEQP